MRRGAAAGTRGLSGPRRRRGVNEEIPDLPAAASFTGGRVCRMRSRKGERRQALHPRVRAGRCQRRPHDDVARPAGDGRRPRRRRGHMLGDRRRLGPPDAEGAVASKSPPRSPLRVNAGDDGAWEPPSKHVLGARDGRPGQAPQGQAGAPGPRRAQGELRSTPRVRLRPRARTMRHSIMAGAGFRRGSAAATPPPRASPTRRAWTPAATSPRVSAAAWLRETARPMAARNSRPLRRLLVGRAAPLRRRRVVLLVLAVVGLVAPRRLRINEVAPRRPLLGFRRLRRRRLPRALCRTGGTA